MDKTNINALVQSIERSGIRISLLQLVKMKRFTQVLRYSKPRPNESDKLKIYPCKTCDRKAL